MNYKGDMIKNHISQVFPKEATSDVPLDTPISVVFDTTVSSVNTSKLFQVKDSDNHTLDGVTGSYFLLI